MLQKIPYDRLNSRQRENYNFQKLSGLLADYGFVTMRLSDDWNGADFIANHMDGQFLRVQLKSRWSIHRKYEGKGLWIAFPSDGAWYLIEHDALVKLTGEKSSILQSVSWKEAGSYSNSSIPSGLRESLVPYQIGIAEHLPIANDDE